MFINMLLLGCQISVYYPIFSSQHLWHYVNKEKVCLRWVRGKRWADLIQRHEQPNRCGKNDVCVVTPGYSLRDSEKLHPEISFGNESNDPWWKKLIYSSKFRQEALKLPQLIKVYAKPLSYFHIISPFINSSKQSICFLAQCSPLSRHLNWAVHNNA